LHFLDEISTSKFIFGKGVDIGDRLAASRLADEFYFITLDVFDAENVEFGKKV
jgi:hypothetical protein